MAEPIHLQMAGKATPRERVWQALRKLKCATNYTIARRANVDDETVRSYLQALIAGGYVDYNGKPPAKPPEKMREVEYRLVRDVGLEAPRLTRAGKPVTQGAGTQQMWVAMKRLKVFFPRELATVASTDAVQVSEETALTYVKFLCRAGYLVLALSARRGCAQRQARYRFNQAKDTGPRAPMIQRVKSVFDPNLGEIVWHPSVAELEEPA